MAEQAGRIEAQVMGLAWSPQRWNYRRIGVHSSSTAKIERRTF